MATESNAGFHREETFSSALNRHAISFQSGAINSTCEMLPMGNYYPMNSSAAATPAGMVFSGSSSSIISNNPVISQAGSSSSGSLLLDTVPGLKHDAGLAVEWSVEEQCKLERGLAEYASEPSIMKYIKIAAILRDKTVRDVALRCRWMMRKRRKQDELILGKKVNNRKDKLVESSSKPSIVSVPSFDMTGYPFIMNHMGQNGCLPFEGMSNTAKHLLEQNAQALSQITANLSAYKLQDNIDLFCCTRSNLNSILNDMRHMPGIMSQMPPLPVSINEDLANSILPNTI
ncbi:uncharacterized protein LOC133824124 isoform X2 [Humulus lupulus]|uniref:uncharacterized protein LOC133824124 isoform X2 n=1 Tax=Humulus lupulus TaxID=3486 RepID=UPI002B414A7E|nr:uncharacterized protein LOC133824124 isoform X2 [Humulus lupulus]XP_062112978.1 uncharacterized protein LOC133824124 isoform X2 [Humulus lupulus]